MAFVKGQSGNPSGRPKAVLEVVHLARKHTADAIQTLVDIRGDVSAPPAARVAASTAILDRAWGKPAQAIGGSEELGPVKHVVTWEDGT